MRCPRANKPSALPASVKPPSMTSPLIDREKREKLEEKGRVDGALNYPPATEPGLGLEEAEVERFYRRHHEKRLTKYREQEKAAKEHMKLARADEDVDGLAEKRCQKMQVIVQAAMTDLKQCRGSVNKARKNLDTIMRNYKLKEHEVGEGPDSRAKFFGILTALLVVETLVNGVFFGANLAGALLGGMTYAALISVVNVLFFGSMAGLPAGWLLPREKPLGDGARRLAIVILIVALPMGVLLNLGVAHYREALPADYPPRPSESPVLANPTPVAALDDDVAACWGGDDETAAGREAICLFWSEWFELGDFQSYIFMLVGLGAFGFAAWKWSERVERWPEYRQADDACDEAEKAFVKKKRTLFDSLEQCRKDAVDEQDTLAAEASPFENWNIANKAYDEIIRIYDHLREDFEGLQDDCRELINRYRSTNQSTRQEPAPDHWQNVEWTPNWKLPEVPTRPDIGSEADAEHREYEARSAKNERIKKLNDCHDRWRNEVKRIEPDSQIENDDETSE